jgi:predicted nucleic acid-binding protein
MITAIDSSVLIDLLAGDEASQGRAEAALNRANEEGSVAVSEAVVAEVSPLFPSSDKLEVFLDDIGARFVPSSLESSLLAGDSFRTYLKRGGKRGRILADFLIAAHAQVHANRLLTRDRGYCRDYFRKLKVWEP